MNRREEYKSNYIIDTRTFKLADGSGFTTEAFVEEHSEGGVTVTQFIVRGVFPTREFAMEAAIQAGRQAIDRGFEPAA